MTENSRDDLRAYRLGKLTVLQLMSLLAVLGLTASIIWQHYF